MAHPNDQMSAFFHCSSVIGILLIAFMTISGAMVFELPTKSLQFAFEQFNPKSIQIALPVSEYMTFSNLISACAIP